MKKWLNWQAPLWRADNSRVKYFDVPLHTVVRQAIIIFGQAHDEVKK